MLPRKLAPSPNDSNDADAAKHTFAFKMAWAMVLPHQIFVSLFWAIYLLITQPPLLIADGSSDQGHKSSNLTDTNQTRFMGRLSSSTRKPLQEFKSSPNNDSISCQASNVSNNEVASERSNLQRSSSRLSLKPAPIATAIHSSKKEITSELNSPHQTSGPTTDKSCSEPVPVIVAESESSSTQASSSPLDTTLSLESLHRDLGILVISRGRRLLCKGILEAAHDFPFGDKEKKTLRNFVLALDSHKSELFGDFRCKLPTIIPSLVCIQVTSVAQLLSKNAQPKLETYICISGMTNLDEIKSFDKVMSKTGNKDFYAPLKLCYQMKRISHSSVSGPCTLVTEQSISFCGTLITLVDIDGVPRTSTVGGLISIAGVTYALTTNHPPDGNCKDQESDYPEESTPHHCLFTVEHEDSQEEDFLNAESSASIPLDTREPIIRGSQDTECDHQSLGNDLLESHQSTTPAYDNKPLRDTSSQFSRPKADDQRENIVTFSLYGENVTEQADWHLTRIRPSDRRPNIMIQTPFRMSNGPGQLRRIREGSASFDTFIDRQIVVSSGRSGIKFGALSYCSSFLFSPTQRVQEVWTVKLNNDDFQAGDSGSWVIRRADSTLLGVLVARSAGNGYMVPFSHIQDEIEAAKGLPQGTVGLPLPETSFIWSLVDHIGSWVYALEVMLTVLLGAKPSGPLFEVLDSIVVSLVEYGTSQENLKAASIASQRNLRERDNFDDEAYSPQDPEISDISDTNISDYEEIQDNPGGKFDSKDERQGSQATVEVASSRRFIPSREMLLKSLGIFHCVTWAVVFVSAGFDSGCFYKRNGNDVCNAIVKHHSAPLLLWVAYCISQLSGMPDTQLKVLRSWATILSCVATWSVVYVRTWSTVRAYARDVLNHAPLFLVRAIVIIRDPEIGSGFALLVFYAILSVVLLSLAPTRADTHGSPNEATWKYEASERAVIEECRLRPPQKFFAAGFADNAETRS